MKKAEQGGAGSLWGRLFPMLSSLQPVPSIDVRSLPSEPLTLIVRQPSMKLGILLASLVMSLAVRANDIKAAVEHFYIDLDALSIRGTVDGDRVDRCGDALTPNYKEAIVVARQGIQVWRDAAKRDPETFDKLKLPLTEGAIFTSVYESGHFTRIESVTEAGDRGYVKVRIHLKPTDGEDDWVDLVILHRVDGRWLIDDILSDVDDAQPVSMRDRLVIPPPKDAEQDGGGKPAAHPETE